MFTIAFEYSPELSFTSMFKKHLPTLDLREGNPIFIEEETNQKGELSYTRSQDCNTQEPEFETKSVWLQNICSLPKP